MAETLKFLIEVGTEKGEAAVARLNQKIEELGKTGSTAAESTSVSMEKAGLAIGALGTAATAALVAMATHAANLGEELHVMSEKTGASVESLQTLGFAAEQSGSSMEGLGLGMKFLAKNAADAAGGGKETGAVFKALGIDVKDAAGEVKGTDKLFLEMADRFSHMQDGAGKTALAIHAFGRAGADMIPTLNLGSAGIQKMGDRLEDVAGTLSGSATNAAHEYTKELHLLERGLEGIGLKIGEALIPELRKLVEEVTPVVAGIRKWVEAHPELVKAVFALSVGLAGSGGLLVAISALNLALPILAQGLKGITLATPIGLFLTLGSVAFAFRYELGALILSIGAFIVEGLGKLVGALGTVAGMAGLDGLRTKLVATKLSLEGTGNGLKDMATQLRAGEPVIIANTKAVDKWIDSQKDAAPIIDKNAEELKKFNELVNKLKADLTQTADLSRKYTDDRALIEALKQLDAQGALSVSQIVKLSDKLKDLKNSSDPTIHKFWEMSGMLKLVDADLNQVKISAADLEKIQLRIRVPEVLQTPAPKVAPPGLGPVKDFTANQERVRDQIRQTSQEFVRAHQAPAELTATIAALGKEMDVYENHLYTDQEIMSRFSDELVRMGEEARRTGVPLDAQTESLVRQARQFQADQKFIEAWRGAWVNATEGVRSAFVNLIFSGKGLSGLGHDLLDTVKGLGKSIVDAMTESLFSPLKIAFDDFFTGLLQSTGIKTFLSGLGSKIAGILPGIGGTVATTATGVAGGAASAAGGVAGGAGGIAGAVSGGGGAAGGAGGALNSLGGIAGTVNMVSGAVTAVASVLGIFQQKRLEGTMNAVELNTRISYIILGSISQDFLAPIVYSMIPTIIDELHTMSMTLEYIGIMTNISAQTAQAGTTAAPTGTAPTVNIPVSVAPTFNFSTQDVTRDFVRNFIVPEITTMLVDGVNGVREKWSSVIKNSQDGLVSNAVVGG